jgi:hypothetical protein
MTTPQIEVETDGGRLLAACERPLVIGIAIGLVMGIANALILAIPLWISLTSGVFLGIAVTMIACPGMRTTLRDRRVANALKSNDKSHSISAFTARE